jgi:DNA-directed RNA polymerase subunit H (RpoH/RPB5)
MNHAANRNWYRKENKAIAQEYKITSYQLPNLVSEDKKINKAFDVSVGS